ncbi:metal-sensitive transcriptional regulator [Stomatohabitans albus]|uniref:metal-sensitive transcriptional regulator n=1 Tax=Stomatohabitans albus TaxID=3110766 RepID=UPI00300D8B65
MEAQDRTALLNRMKRIQGQVRAITTMIEDGEYCIDVLTQITAAKRALEKVSLVLVDDHLRGCVRHAATSGDQEEIDQKIEEINTLLGRMLKT